MSVIRVLALCARAQMPESLHERVRQAAAACNSWDGFVDAAEQHGIAPMVYMHLRAAGAMPAEVARPLAALALRHRQAAAAREQAIGAALALFRREQIGVLVLKGAALAHLVYPSPDLRPMRDVDLLVRAADAERAWRLLAGAGFDLPPTPADGLPAGHHHLATATRSVDGVTVSVEVHHAVSLNEPRRRARTYDDWEAARVPFTLGGEAAYAPPREELLWHVYRHAFCMPLGYEPLRLVWAADLNGLVEAWADALDWDTIKKRYRALWFALAQIDALTPWSESARAHLPPLPACPAGIAEDVITQWPRFVPDRPLSRSLARIARNVIAPPAWWMRVRYGGDATAAGTAAAWLRHQWTAWTQAARYPFAPPDR